MNLLYLLWLPSRFCQYTVTIYNFYFGEITKGVWRRNMVNIGLPPTCIRTLAKVGRLFGCAGCIKFGVTSSQNGDINSMPRVKKVPRSLDVKSLATTL